MKNILLYIIGFLAIPVIVFIFFFILTFPSQINPDIKIYTNGKGDWQTTRTLAYPFICTYVRGMGEGSINYYCSFPEFFKSMAFGLIPGLVTYFFWLLYLLYGLIFLLTTFIIKIWKKLRT